MVKYYSKRNHGGHLCCWILFVAIFIAILVNLSHGQPQNYFKGAITVPSKALPRIGRRNGLDSGIPVLDGQEAEDGSDDDSSDDDGSPTIPVDNSHPLLSSLFGYNNNNYHPSPQAEDNGSLSQSDGQNSQGRQTEEQLRNVSNNPRGKLPKSGLIYIWKTLGRRESEAARRRGNGGFRQDQPTGIHQYR